MRRSHRNRARELTQWRTPVAIRTGVHIPRGNGGSRKTAWHVFLFSSRVTENTIMICFKLGLRTMRRNCFEDDLIPLAPICLAFRRPHASVAGPRPYSTPCPFILMFLLASIPNNTANLIFGGCYSLNLCKFEHLIFAISSSHL